MSVKLSFIVPVYNTDQFLDECLTSIERQSYANIEIICINNNSTDNSGRILLAHQALDNRYIYLDEPNQGVSNARNKGLDTASGDYVLFIDSDDYIDSELAMTIVSAIDETGAEIVMYPYDHYFARTNEYRAQSKKKMDPPFAKPLDLGSRLFSYTNGSCLKAFKRSLIEKYALRFDKTVRFGEDLLFSHTALMLADSIYQIQGHALYHYRKEVENSATTKRASSEGSLEILDVLNKLESVRVDHSLPEVFELALLNHAINETRYALTLSTKVEHFDEFYSEFSKTWKDKYSSYDKEAFINQERFESFIEPSTTIEVLYREQALLRKKNAELRKENASLKRAAKKFASQLNSAENKIERIRRSKAFKLGNMLLKPFRALRKS